MTQQLRAYTAVLDKLNLVPSTHIRQLTTIRNSSFKDPMSSSDLLRHLHTNVNVHTHKHKQINKEHSNGRGRCELQHRESPLLTQMPSVQNMLS